MKRFFENAELELICFAAADIITTSTENNKPFPGEDDEV